MDEKVEVLLRKIAPLVSLNKKLNKFKYGIKSPDGKKVIENFTEKYFNDHYLHLAITEFNKIGGGVCWDYTRAYDEIIRKLNIGFETINLFIYYGTNKNDFYTHTVTIVPVSGAYVWLESAWKSMCGIYLASDFNQLIIAIVKTLINETANSTMPYIYSVHDFYDLPEVGTNGPDCLEYFLSSKVVSKGKATADGIKYFRKLNETFSVITSETKIIFEDAEDDEIFTEAVIPHTFVMKNLLEEKIFAALGDSEKLNKYKKIQSDYINRNSEKLATAGPEYLIVFGDRDHKEYYDLFGLTKEEVSQAIIQVVKSTGSGSPFKFATQNPILHVIYFCIRYFTIQKDEKAVNSALGIYALGVYWSTFTKYFPKGVNAAVMAYTIDNMSWKFEIKKAGTIFNVLLQSIQQSYSFHKKRFLNGDDNDVCAFSQRIKNDQNSMFRKIANQYMDNYHAGKTVTTRNDDYDADNPIVDDVENATTKIATLTAAIVPQMVSNGVDLRLAMAAAKMAKISVNDCREYLTQLITNKYLTDIESIVQSTLYVFLMNGQKSSREIKSQYFLLWGWELFKKTNSNDKNINNINRILRKWAVESGIYERYGKSSRINYEKAIYVYIILTIQKYTE